MVFCGGLDWWQGGVVVVVVVIGVEGGGLVVVTAPRPECLATTFFENSQAGRSQPSPAPLCLRLIFSAACNRPRSASGTFSGSRSSTVSARRRSSVDRARKRGAVARLVHTIAGGRVCSHQVSSAEVLNPGREQVSRGAFP